MRASKKYPTIIYSILCIVLLVALLAGIAWVANLAPRHNAGETVETYKENESNELSFAENYEIDVRFGRVTIQTTDQTPYIETQGRSKIRTSNSANTCSVLVEPINPFGFNFDNGFEMPKVNIYLPKDIIKFKLITNAGDTKVIDLTSSKFDIEVNAGNVTIKDCAFDEIETDLSAGNLDVYTPSSIRKIDADVTAGNLNLYLSKAISGFVCSYDVTAGSFDNDTSFDTEDKKTDAFINESGTIVYGDSACRIDIELTAGNVELKDYR